jgi:uncharacterized protein YbjQ (UPF0145 family)
MIKLLLMLVTAVSFHGCTTGSELLTEQVYPAIDDHTAVSILTEMPEGAEHIAVLKASSESGPDQQQRFANAVEDLQIRASKVGANAVVLTDRSTTAQAEFFGPSGTGGAQMTGITQRESVEGIAIFVR